MPIDRTSPIPLYFQLKTYILEKIKLNELKAGDKLPTAEEFQKQFAVSSTTVRQALQELEQEGVLVRKAGKGTFITRPVIQEGPDSFEKDFIQLRDHGVQLRWKIIQQDKITPSKEIASQLLLDSTEKVFHMRRLRIANEQTIGYSDSYLRMEYLPKIDLSLAEMDGSMNYLSQMEIHRCTAERVIEAKRSVTEDSELLHIPIGAPVLSLKRTLLCPDLKPIEFFYGRFNGDLYRYHIRGLQVQI